MQPLYQIQTVCKHCNRDFKSSRVRPSFKKSIRSDTDFCTYYKEDGENPDFYVVRVCPYCGFSATDSFERTLTEKQREEFKEKISSSWGQRDYGGRRSLSDALVAYKLALVCAQIADEKDRVIAGLLHHIAWLYRYIDDEANERRFLRYAMESYIRVFETEAGEVNNARLMFLIGELHRRLKEYHSAVRWFNKVINDRKITDSGMIRACREGWATAREDMLAESVELPEEMQSAGK